MKLSIKTLFVLLFFSLIFLPKNIEARSGCCSHHDGVCGCRCCDGSSLSSTCAPYYPSCNTVTNTIKTVQPTFTPKPTLVPTKVPVIVPTKIPTIIPTNTPIPTPTLIITSSPIETPILTPTIEPTKAEGLSPTSTLQTQVLGETINKPIKPPKAIDFIIFFSLLGLIGFGIYKLFTKIKNIIIKIIKKRRGI